MKHKGSCHCGAVCFTAEVATESGVTCNCSHCSRKGFILAFIAANAFTLEQGADNLTEYWFNKKQIQHLFCKTCGVESFSRGKDEKGGETVAINLRCIESIDCASIKTTEFNGKEY